MENLGLSKSFWKGKNVLVTGHTGFKGSWLVMWLARLGANVCGIALPPMTAPDLFSSASVHSLLVENHYCDIRDTVRVTSIVQNFAPEIVFHLAAQPLVKTSYDDPISTFDINVMGTVSVLDALRQVSSVKAVVMITTDKVYKNLEHNYPFRESDQLGGYDPYSASKAASEIVISSYMDSFLQEKRIALATARAGNVIGGGDWSDYRLLPDAVKSWNRNEAVDIRMPHAVRPWQHVLEPLLGYLVLAQRLYNNSECVRSCYNFGPDTSDVLTVGEVIQAAAYSWGIDEYDAINFASTSSSTHESSWLSLDTSKARFELGVTPCWKSYEAVDRTVQWYKSFYNGISARQLCDNDIDSYECLL